MRTKVGVPFELDDEAMGHVTIMYPADLGGEEYKVPPSMIWNCRCTIRGVVKGLTPMARRYADLSAIGGNYEAWKRGHGKSERITKGEEISEAMRRKYINEYRRR